MKFSLSLIIAFFAALFSVSSAQAQGSVFNDTIMIFRVNPEFILGDGIVMQQSDFGKAFLIRTPSQVALVSAATAKSLVLPKGAKTTKGPIVLVRDGKCYEFSCQKGQGCNNCTMVWYDRNGDGKVQPRRELRCVCTAGEQCKIRVRRLRCQ